MVMRPARRSRRLALCLLVAGLAFLGQIHFQVSRIALADTPLTEFPAPDGAFEGGVADHGISKGPDGNIWLTEHLGNKILKLSSTGSLIAEHAVPPEEPGAANNT